MITSLERKKVEICLSIVSFICEVTCSSQLELHVILCVDLNKCCNTYIFLFPQLHTLHVDGIKKDTI